MKNKEKHHFVEDVNPTQDTSSTKYEIKDVLQDIDDYLLEVVKTEFGKGWNQALNLIKEKFTPQNKNEDNSQQPDVKINSSSLGEGESAESSKIISGYSESGKSEEYPSVDTLQDDNEIKDCSCKYRYGYEYNECKEELQSETAEDENEDNKI